MSTRRCRELVKFIAATNKDPKAVLLAEKSGLPPPSQVKAALDRFLIGGTTWDVRDPGTYDYGYRVEVEETIIEHEGKPLIVWEIGATYMSRDHKRVHTDIREWFHRDDLEGLMLGIECKIRIPRQMYTGLGFACNL